MTKIFRYLTAEYNGNWLRGMYYCLNLISEQYNDIFAYLRNMVFKLEDEDITDGEIPITEDDLYGIGIMAGVFPPFISSESNAGSLVFTTSNTVRGVEYSERGLMNRTTEMFDFVRTDPSVYPTDITTLASHNQQSSMIPEGAPILGYIAEGTAALTIDGEIIPSAILSTPPVGVAYYPYYGDKYLFLSETFLRSVYLDSSTFKKMFESMQKIRFNGYSISELAKVTEAILGDYVYNIYFTYTGYRVYLHYSLFETSPLEMKVKKLFVWKLLLSIKYKQVTVIEEI